MKALVKQLGINEKYTKVRNPQQKVFNKVKNNIPNKEDINLMADLLFLPTTKKGYKYLLVVVDLATNEFDLEPLKDKESANTKAGLEKIFKRGKYIDGAKAIRTDDGTEFKGVFNKYLYDNNILHKTALPKRHTQLANVDTLSRQLGRLLNGYMNTKEKETGKVYREWDTILPIVIKELNKIRKVNEKTLNNKEYPFFNPDKPPKFKVGDTVHEKLDHPENALGNKQPTSNFREGDFRYSTVPKKITKVIYMLDEPYYRYMLSGISDASFSENQLMRSQFKTERYKVKSIIDDRMNGNKKEYLVWWVGYKKKESTWEPRANLIKDGLKKMLDEYDELNG